MSQFRENLVKIGKKLWKKERKDESEKKIVQIFKFYETLNITEKVNKVLKLYV